MHKILLIITGSIAAYKSLDLISLLRQHGHEVTAVMTKSAQEFITPLAVASLTGREVYSELFCLKDESQMGHIRLSREHDLVVVAPASANIIAKLAHGFADDLASTLLLASDKPVVMAPAMNVQMWHHLAVQRNILQLQADGVHLVGPAEGLLACGEIGLGRMTEPKEILNIINRLLS